MRTKLIAVTLVSAGLIGGAVALADDAATLDVAKSGTLPLAEIQAMLADAKNHEPFVPGNPVGIAKLDGKIPADNPLTRAKVELGRQLYFDKRLSRDETVSCATCHDPAKGWTDQAPVSTGIDGQKGGRSAPTVMNRVLHPTQFWDGRAATLEEQALGPIGNPIEMGFSVEESVKLLDGIEGYRIQFEKVFGGPASADGIAQAIASFERTIVTGASPWDLSERAKPWREADPDDLEEADLKMRAEIIAAADAAPLSESAERGRVLFFGKAQCATCHTGENFTDELYYNLGIGWTGDAAKFDKGREDHTKAEKDRGAFRTPTVRNIRDTAPYMHDGSLKTLAEVVEHYAKGGTDNPWLAERMREIGELGLTEEEKADLVAFMRDGLQGAVTKVETPRLP